MAMPSYIMAYVYADFTQVGGQLQELNFLSVRSFGGAVFLLSLSFYPYVYLFARSGFINQSTCLYEASRTLGCGPVRSFWSIGLALARPSIVVGVLLVVMETFAEFGAVQHLSVDTLSTGIVRTWFGLGDMGSASALALVLFVLCVGVVFTERFLRGRSGFEHTTRRYQNIRKVQLRPLLNNLAFLFCLSPVVLGFFVPVTLLCFHMSQLSELWQPELFWEVSQRSFWVASLAATLLIIVSVGIVFGTRVYRNNFAAKGRAWVDFISLGYAVAGGVLAIGMLSLVSYYNAFLDSVAIYFPSEHLAKFLEYFYLSSGVGILLYAYMVRFLFIPVQSLYSGISKLPQSILSSPRVLGAGALYSTLKVYLPMIMSSLLVAWLLVFVDVIKELPATILIRPFHFDTLAIYTYNLAADEKLKEAAPGCLMIVLICLLPTLVLMFSLNKSRPGSKAGD
jgi:iron(III) transport system permease protein